MNCKTDLKGNSINASLRVCLQISEWMILTDLQLKDQTDREEKCSKRPAFFFTPILTRSNSNLKKWRDNNSYKLKQAVWLGMSKNHMSFQVHKQVNKLIHPKRKKINKYTQ